MKFAETSVSQTFADADLGSDVFSHKTLVSSLVPTSMTSPRVTNHV